MSWLWLDQMVHSLATDLAATRQQERAMIDNTAEIICSLDDSFRFNEVNPAVTVRLGYDQEAVRGSLFFNLMFMKKIEKRLRSVESHQDRGQGSRF